MIYGSNKWWFDDNISNGIQQWLIDTNSWIDGAEIFVMNSELKYFSLMKNCKQSFLVDHKNSKQLSSELIWRNRSGSAEH